MAKRIEKLTPEQEIELVSFRAGMWRQGTSTAPVDRARAVAAITAAYAEIGRPAPRFFFMSSPMTCALALHALGNPPLVAGLHEGLRDGLRNGLAAGLAAGIVAGLHEGLVAGLADGIAAGLRTGIVAGLATGLVAGLHEGLVAGLADGIADGLHEGLATGIADGLRDWDIEHNIGSTWWWGQMDSYWLAYYRFASLIGCPQNPVLLKRLAIMEDIAASCGFWYPRDGVCIVSDRFASVSWDGARNAVGLPFRLHSAEGPAVSFRDGWGLYYWHGFRLPPDKQWIITDKLRLTPALIDAEPNAELRRVMLEVMGFDRYLAARPYKVLASDDLHGQPRRLIEIEAREPIRVIEVHNGSLEPDGSRRRFHLGAMPGETPHDVVAASYGIAPEVYREAVRT